jgi:cytidylate kinase
MIVAIDGPAGAGKSTVARRVAARLGFQFLDTGALYRAVAWATLHHKVSPQSAAADTSIELGDRIIVDGHDVTEAIRTADVTREVPKIAKRPEVRAALLPRQRQLMATGDWVAEGRDIGTVVAPDAEVKVYLYATPEVRARRRAAETGEPYDIVLIDIKARDEHDATRPDSPLRPAVDAEAIDSTRMTLDEVVEEIVLLTRTRRSTMTSSSL